MLTIPSRSCYYFSYLRNLQTATQRGQEGCPRSQSQWLTPRENCRFQRFQGNRLLVQTRGTHLPGSLAGSARKQGRFRSWELVLGGRRCEAELSVGRNFALQECETATPQQCAPALPLRMRLRVCEFVSARVTRVGACVCLRARVCVYQRSIARRGCTAFQSSQPCFTRVTH